MKWKKISLKVVITMIMVMTVGLFQVVKAVTDLSTNPVYFGIVIVFLSVTLSTDTFKYLVSRK